MVSPKRLLFTALVLLLILSLGTTLGQNIWLSGFLLPNLLPQNRFRPLEWVTRKPQIMRVAIPYGSSFLEADLYVPAKPGAIHKVLLAIHGANERGKDDSRLVNAGQTFARAGMVTLIPTFPDISPQRFTPQAREEIIAVYGWLTRRFPGKPSGMIAFSVAVGPMFLAATEERVNRQTDYLISFGGYYELKEVLRNVTTGANRDAYGLWVVTQQYRNLFGSDESLRHLLDNTKPAQFDGLFDALSPNVHTFISDLSPAGKLAGVRAKKVFLLHSDPDPLIPTSESLRLQQALGCEADLVILKGVSHVTVELPQPNCKDIFNIYVPEFVNLYRVTFQILNL